MRALRHNGRATGEVTRPRAPRRQAAGGPVDEYRLIIQPVALGAGLPLFRDLPAPLRLRLVEAHTYPDGTAIHVYRPATR